MTDIAIPDIFGILWYTPTALESIWEVGELGWIEFGPITVWSKSEAKAREEGRRAPSPGRAG